MRATLITRDPNPVWQPASLAQVTEDEVRGEGRKGREGRGGEGRKWRKVVILFVYFYLFFQKKKSPGLHLF